jgi:(2Fe-2S) ferredoxin
MAKPEIHILVCANERPEGAAKPSCGPRGGLEVYRRFKDLVRERGVRETVMTTRTGCLKHCSRGITVAVWPSNHWYQGVTTEDVAEILEAALTGREVERLRMPDIPWE